MTILALKGCNCKKWQEVTHNDHDDSITLVKWNGNKLTFNYCPWCGKELDRGKK